MSRHLVLLLAFLLALPGLRAQEEVDPAIAKLRDNLRKTLVQLRDVQGQLATLQAQKIQDDAKIASQAAKLEKLTKQSAADKLAAEKTIADYETKFAAQDARNAKQVVALGKWKKSYDQLLGQAKEVDAKRAALATQKIALDRKVADQQAKNQALYTLGKEILHRYERYGLGDALLAREPFIGLSKVKFETYIQDNGDKLADQKVKP